MPRLIILIKEIRKSKGLSILQLSLISGVSHTEIARIERGVVSPTLDTLHKLAIALNVRLNDTFYEE